ncbi:FtsH protease activity modulator HflK [Tolumonas osonensis]|uniref:Protein HflK n=1 Tax=Tolumonas osonensis TaxID=675874 RepID=A0A841G9A0_9GAMM|nr:FtsH protease activity modulator HflK [Tolumonas osonensis]MBB6055608.1 membrane protease subunit HflK [Tolumonas osonensis]
MAWNEPGNNNDKDKDRDPWKNTGKSQIPPDVDKLLKSVRERLTGTFGGQSSGGSTGLVIFALLAVVIWIGSGFYTIEEAERGVVLRFGKYHETVDPGLRWKWTFIDKVIPVDVESVKSIPSSGFMLTQDENVVRVEMDVQYRVVNPREYLFSVTNADDSLREATDSALRYVVGHTSMDDLLTRGREKVRQNTWQVLEGIINPYRMGLAIVDVNFLPARPPEEVKDAFDDAISAQEDEQRFIREAEAYARETEPKARGQVKRLEEESLAYKEQVVLKATGEVARFNQLLPEYTAAPQLTRERLYLDTMEELYQKTNKVLIDVPKGNNNVIYLPLDKMNTSQTNTNNRKDGIPATLSSATNSNSQAGSSTESDSGVDSVTDTQPLRDSSRTSGRY